MAYVSQETKKALAPQIKAVLKKYGMKGTIAVNHHSTLVVNIREGRLDVISNYIKVAKPEHEVVEGRHDVNPYWMKDFYDGEVLDFLLELKDAMNATPDGKIANHDKSDVMTDYFDVGWYIDINIGTWNKPYTLVA